MDGNKDEAMKCLDLAEQCIKEKNKERAQKFLNKAEKLFPTKRGQDLLLQVFIMPDTVEEIPTKTRKPAKKPEAIPVKAQYTTEQMNLVKRVRSCKDYYEILGCTKDSGDVEIKKAYRKIALQLHPDKNSAPGADEAFKAVGNAVAILTDPEKRKQYDLYGADAANRKPTRTRRNSFEYTRGFDADINPEELFNIFFGQGFSGSNTFVRRGARWHRQSSNNQTEYTRDPNNGMSTFVQLLPIIVAILLSMMSSFFISDPAYSLSHSSKYPVQRHTQISNILYFVKQNFHTDYQGSVARLEEAVEQEYINNYSYQCNRQRAYKDQLRWKAKHFNSDLMKSEAEKIQTSACDEVRRVVQRRKEKGYGL